MSLITRTTQKRRKVLITGGSGTVGLAFINKYYDEFEFFNISRRELSIASLNRKFPRVHSYVADIQNLDQLNKAFQEIRPDIVIHAAALKHVNDAEVNPSRTVQINILGSLNVAKASVAANVSIVVGVSTDKACQPENIYGYSKKILEQMFLEHYTEQSRFVCTRFANVACSSGSVIPFWIESAKKNKPLKLTDSRMNRLMFTQEDAAQLIRESIEFAELSTNPFIMCSRMKSVGMLDLANLISSDFGNGSKPLIVGLRPGEQLNEVLVSQRELPNAFYTRDGRYIILHSDEYGEKRVTEPLSSLTADYMSETQMRFLYSEYLELAVPSLSLAHSNR
ncbi:MAG: UDP-N-acetylglucosamine 4,6-dehydratase [Granulosicoccus sp.]|jgi:UDP-N-acetylglucosamine 4,6-dehydratase